MKVLRISYNSKLILLIKNTPKVPGYDHANLFSNHYVIMTVQNYIAMTQFITAHAVFIMYQ